MDWFCFLFSDECDEGSEQGPQGMVKTIEIEDTDVCIITLVLLPALSDLAIYVSLLHL
jgi:hypothetical protein